MGDEFKKPISINYLKSKPYFGSFNGVSFALLKKEDKLEAYVYPGPFSFEKTPEEDKQKAEFEFSDQGYDEATDWMSRRLKEYEIIPHGKRFALNNINKG